MDLTQDTCFQADSPARISWMSFPKATPSLSLFSYLQFLAIRQDYQAQLRYCQDAYK